MQVTAYQVIILVSVVLGFILMYSGRTGIDVLLYLCGVALLLAAGVSNRGVVVRIIARGFKFGMSLLPSRTSDSPATDNLTGSSDDSRSQLPDGEDR